MSGGYGQVGTPGPEKKVEFVLRGTFLGLGLQFGDSVVRQEVGVRAIQSRAGARADR